MGASMLYTINLGTGAATSIGQIGGSSRIRALAAGGVAPADATAPTVQIVKVTAPKRVAALVKNGAYVRVSCSEACTVNIRLQVGTRVVATGTAQIDVAGSVPVRLRITAAGATFLRP